MRASLAVACARLGGSDVLSTANDATGSRETTSALAAGVCVLLGVALACAVTGLDGRLTGCLEGAADVGNLVVACALVSLAMGVRLPRQVAVWACTAAWRRFAVRGKPDRLCAALVNPDPADRSFFWLALSVMALAAGIAAAMFPLNVRLALAFHDWMFAHFIWGPLTGVALSAATVLTACVMPLTLTGLALSCAHQLGGRCGDWDCTATGWVSIGLAVSLAALDELGALRPGNDVLLSVASLPMLVVAVLAAGRRAPRSTLKAAPGSAEAVKLPQWTDRRPRLLRASVVLLGCAAVWTVALPAPQSSPHGAAELSGIPFMFMAIGAGVIFGTRVSRLGSPSIGGFGIAATTAAATAVSAAYVLSGRPDETSGLVGLALPVSAATLSFAATYGNRVLLDRAAGRARAGATILWRVTFSGALLVIAADMFIERSLAFSGSLALTAMVAGALGAALIASEPAYSPRARLARLVGVFALLAVVLGTEAGYRDQAAPLNNNDAPSAALAGPNRLP